MSELEDNVAVLDHPNRCVALVVVHNIKTAGDPQCLRRGRFTINGEWYCWQHYRMRNGG